MIYQALFSMIATFAFAVLTNMRFKHLLFGALGNGIAWFLYLYLSKYLGYQLLAIFLSTLIIGFYAEIVAKFLRAPSTPFMICGIVSLVPGSTMYYAMFAYVRKHLDQAISLSTKAILISGVIAIALAIVSSVTKNIKKNI